MGVVYQSKDEGLLGVTETARPSSDEADKRLRHGLSQFLVVVVARYSRLSKRVLPRKVRRSNTEKVC